MESIEALNETPRFQCGCGRAFYSWNSWNAHRAAGFQCYPVQAFNIMRLPEKELPGMLDLNLENIYRDPDGYWELTFACHCHLWISDESGDYDWFTCPDSAHTDAALEGTAGQVVS